MRWFTCLAIFATLVPTQAQDRDEYEQAQAIAKRKRAGEELSSADAALMGKYVERGWISDMDPKRTTTGLVPLTEMSAADVYKGEDGGLYGQGRNDPDARHQMIIDNALTKIVPRDPDGESSHSGKVVMISVGMSNTSREFGPFIQAANADRRKSPELVIVNCAQGSRAALQWVEMEDVWQGLKTNLTRNQVTTNQVQVAWVKLTEMAPSKYGAFPKHAEFFKGNLIKIIQRLKATCPNLGIIYFSSRVYAGYAVGDRSLNPEPYAYEGAFAMRWLIQDQLKGDRDLNYDATKGPVKAPLLLWGPYLWCDGMKPRSDGLIWPPEYLDFDGVHPSDAGKAKITELLIDFFATNPNAKPWFTGNSR
ncbi:MAG: hypothetical protein KDN20_10385 [Verrucomicrobiae bacterium]|nr:hypothetical protein [Verrucomicrobiae bacterium]